MNLSITKERVLDAAASCPDAKNVLTKLFPEVFAEDIIKPWQMTIIGENIVVYRPYEGVRIALADVDRFGNGLIAVRFGINGKPISISRYNTTLLRDERRITSIRVRE